MKDDDKKLLMDLLEAVEEWLLLIMQQPTPLYAHRKAARERLVDALEAVAERAGEGE